MMAAQTDRIVKKTLLRAPRERVWNAISRATEFGTWFGMAFDGEFVAGERITGRIVPTTVDADVARSQEPYAGQVFDVLVDRVEPMDLLSFRWHPFAVDEWVDDSEQPMTEVCFELEEVAGGTMLTITESGFDRIPIERRATAFARNEQGWTAQMKLVEAYLAHAA